MTCGRKRALVSATLTRCRYFLCGFRPHLVIRGDIDSITLFMSLEAKAHKKKKKNLDSEAYTVRRKRKVAIHCVFRANFSFCRFLHRL